MNFKYYKPNNLIGFIAVLAIISNIFYLYMDGLLVLVPLIKNISNYIGFLSTLGIMYLSLNLIDKYLWRYNVSNSIIKIPNLNGRYEGKVISSYLDENNKQIKLDCVMEIKQTASEINVHTYIGRNGQQTSQSETICEYLKKESNGFFTLYYSYGNTSNLNVEFNDHKGTAYLNYYKDEKCLIGNYFNERKNNGEIRVCFISKKILGRYNAQI